ncbi:DUF2188 domain-containing protein [Cohnella candidum]|uniref:DUF2188 domain-containing protein n=1 Tax=Cohnella candidum TaxID=2674991 RepID=A0A3G3K0H2_9BACL|nr:DUF2188 domain-containing protein [Cohnella candidum]AYQ74008.1 DUF2188 domain-containing protein [Cohnella candidum]
MARSDRKPASVHTVPNREGGWDNKQGGKTIHHEDTKSEAAAAGREAAKRDRTEHVIHNRDGRISGSDSYGHDPFPPRG